MKDPKGKEPEPGPGQEIPPQNPFYIVPKDPYEYQHPEGTGHDAPPFASIWCVSARGHQSSLTTCGRWPSGTNLAN